MERCTALRRVPLRPTPLCLSVQRSAQFRTFRSSALHSDTDSSRSTQPKPSFRIARTSNDQHQAGNPKWRSPRHQTGRERRSRESSSFSEEDGEGQEDFEDMVEKMNKAAKPPPEPQPYAPETFTAESLVTNRVAIASGTRLGARASMREAMARLARREDTSFTIDAELARKLGRGELMRFRNADEKARVVALAEEFAQDTSEKKGRKKGMHVEPVKVGFQSVGGAQKTVLIDKVLKGKYERPKGPAEKGQPDGTLGNVKQALKMNGTYQSTAGIGFMGLLKKFIPQ